jgi:Rrf2 family cysteine metabolism transcriptional repressor
LVRNVIVVSDKSRAAAEALCELARRGGQGPVPIQEVANGRGLPLHYLEQLFGSLRRAGILQSQRGVKGGYSFARPPNEVTLLEVVETVDGRLGPAPPDPDPPGCLEPWMAARDTLAAHLAEITIADVQELDERIQDAPMFHI